MEIDIVGFFLGIWQEVIAAGIIALAGGSAIWFRSRTFIKREEYTHLKAIEANHKKCAVKYDALKTSYDGLSETCAPYLEQKRRELISRQIPEFSLPTKEDIRQRGLDEALRPLETRTYFDPRKVQK
jgi:hypothetical protein